MAVKYIPGRGTVDFGEWRKIVDAVTARRILRYIRRHRLKMTSWSDDGKEYEMAVYKCSPDHVAALKALE